IPRLLPERGISREYEAALTSRVRKSFGYEWKHFDQILPEFDAEATNYFRLVPEEALSSAKVLDAGCGMGRWAVHVSQRPVARLYAVDFSLAIDHAAVRLLGYGNAHCVEADICDLPFRPQTFDFVYCL